MPLKATRLVDDAERWDVAPASTSYRDAMRPSWREPSKRTRPLLSQPPPRAAAKKPPSPGPENPPPPHSARVLDPSQRERANEARQKAETKAVRAIRAAAGFNRKGAVDEKTAAKIAEATAAIRARPLEEFYRPVSTSERRDQAIAAAVRQLKAEAGEEDSKKTSPELRARIETVVNEIAARPLSEFTE